MAETKEGKIVGYVLAKIDDEDSEKDHVHAHITSISVLRSHHKIGLSTALMQTSQKAMHNVYEAEYCLLHVRASNRAGIALYRDTLGFEVIKTEAKLKPYPSVTKSASGNPFVTLGILRKKGLTLAFEIVCSSTDHKGDNQPGIIKHRP